MFLLLVAVSTTFANPLPPPFDTEPFDTDVEGNSASNESGFFRKDGGPEQFRYFLGTGVTSGSLIMDFTVPFTDGPGNDFAILTNSSSWGSLADKALFEFFLQGNLQASFVESLTPDHLFEFDLPGSGLIADRVRVTNITPDPGGNNLATMTFDDAGVAYNFVEPVTGCTDASFSQSTGSPLTVGDEPHSVAINDFNLDGNPDLATANFDSDNITVLLGNGNGSFIEASGSPFAVGDGPRFAVTTDLNLDGNPDLATANYNSDNLTILLGNGRGGFNEATDSPYELLDGPFSLVVADFNLDGRPDLASSNYNSDNVRVLLGNRHGGLDEAQNSPIAVGDGPRSVAVGDFNLDGRPDLATANFDSDQVTVLLGEGNGEFSEAASIFTVGDGPNSVSAGDFNFDGKSDLVTANVGSNNITVLLGDGKAGFSEATNSPLLVGNSPRFVRVGDLNMDGKPDLATANYHSDNITILFGIGNGNFTEAPGSPLEVGKLPRSIAIGDFNRDGKLDLATANSFSDNATVMLNTCDAFPCNEASLDLAPVATFAANLVAAGDFNRDAKPDLATVDATGVTVRLGGGNGQFNPAPGSPFQAGNGPSNVAAADFNRDGKLDLVTCNLNGLAVLLGDGDGGLGQASILSTNTDRFVAVGDFNLDGKPDLATTTGSVFPSANLDKVTVLLGDGNGGFNSAPESFEVGLESRELVVGDFNQDGNPDIVVGFGRPSDWTLLEGDGNGGFVESVNFGVGGIIPLYLVAADFNLDGKTDLIASIVPWEPGPPEFIPPRLAVLLGRGDGSFENITDLDPFDLPDVSSSLAVGDFDLDGIPDLVSGNSLKVLLGDGSGSFKIYPFSEVDGVFSIAVGDFNLDGRADIATAGQSGTVMLNTCSAKFKLSINNITVKETSSGIVNADFTVTVDPVADVDVKVHYETADGTARVVRNDYTAISGNLIIPAGEATGTITVPIIGDRIAEPTETFFVNLASPVNATIINNQGSGTISNKRPSITINDASVVEGVVGKVKCNFTVTSSFVYTNAGVRVNYVTENGTAISGSDYQATSSLVTIRSNSTGAVPIGIPVFGDKLLESNETFRVRLSTSDASIGDGVGVCTVVNDDAPPSLSVNNVTVTEGDSGTVNAQFTINQSAVSGLNTRVTFRTANGTARSGATQDYFAKNATVFIPPGSTAITVDVSVNGDTVVETDEVFFVNLLDPMNATIADEQGVATILNDD
jgi:hypothetical protein